MIPYERRQQILQLLEQEEVVSLERFCRALDKVSESTVRRDLKTLAEEGQVILLRGGGARLKRGSYEVPVFSKQVQNVREKDQIAHFAASLVKDGEVIYLDSGTTPLRMIKYLRDKQITMVTTNAMVYPELYQANHISCIMVGGEINVTTGSIWGTTTNSFLADTYFDRAFIGANGFSELAGVSTHDMKEAEKKRIVRNNAKAAYVLADSSKAGVSTMCKVYELGSVPIICDKENELLSASGNYMVAK